MFSEKTILKLQELKISMYEAERALKNFVIKMTNQKKFIKHALTQRKISDLNVYVGEYLFEQNLICDDYEAIGYFLEDKTKNEVAKLAFSAIGHRYYNYSMKVKNSFKNGN